MFRWHFPIRFKALSVVIALSAGFTAAPVSSSNKSPTNGDPVIGDAIAKAFVFGGKLWLRGVVLRGKDASGGLISLEMKDNSRQVHFKESVLDIASSGRDFWVLRHDSAKHLFIITAWQDGHFEDRGEFSLPNGDEPIALLASGLPVVLSLKTVRILNSDNTWHVVELKGQPRSGVQVSAASAENGVIYIGIDRGEWGGGIQRVDLNSGVVTDIERRDAKGLCSGPLNKECDPVTGVISDPQNKECVLASIGLVHMFHSRGRILRICGERVELVTELSLSAHENNMWPNTKAFYGLATGTGSGFWGITPGQLYYFDANGQKLNEYALPKLELVSGIHLSRALPGVIVLQTVLNWAVSTSGYTPMVVPVEGTPLVSASN